MRLTEKCKKNEIEAEESKKCEEWSKWWEEQNGQLFVRIKSTGTMFQIINNKNIE